MPEDNGASPLSQITPPDTAGWENDPLTSQEIKNWDQHEELSRARHDNALLIHKTIRWLIPGALILGFLCFSFLSIIYVLHLLLPQCRRWLSPDEVHHIHSMIFSGVVGGAIASLGKMYLGNVKAD